ncbi:MAG: flagellar motor switch protein FliG [Armatimonadetes bacterium]|nr:flagellar motor switch protein FliG [Armatimonadota bacterium]
MAEAESHSPVRNLPGIRKASMLLVALGSDLTANVMQQLTPDEIERLTAEIVQVPRVEPTARKHIFDETRKAMAEMGTQGGIEYARKILEQVVGESKATELLGRLNTHGGNVLRWLRSIPPRQLTQFLSDERPQVAALVLGHLPAEQSAQVMAALPEHLQGEVALRLTQMQPTDPDIVKYVADVLLQRLSLTESAAFTEVGGNKSVIQILNNVDRSTEKKILDYLTKVNEEIANQIKAGMFVFEDILNLDSRSIQIILRDVPQEDLRLALKGSSETQRQIFFENMSQRAAETLKEDLEASGPVRMRDVEAAQLRIASIARQLDEAGEISIRDTGEEVLV